MAFKDSKSVYDSIMKQQLPQKWTTPQPIKNSYQSVLNAQKIYQPQINQNMAEYADNTPITGASAYKNLVDNYTKEYQDNAALAAAETIKASQEANAGFGDSYSKAATDQAYTGYMANIGAAYPQLMAAAADAIAQDKAALANGIDAMSAQRKLNTSAAQQMYSSKFNDYSKEQQAKTSAFDTLNNSLLSLYSAKKATETASSGGSSGDGSGNPINNPTPINEGTTPSYKDYTNLYNEALAEIKKYGGSGLMTPEEFNRRKSNYASYDAYVDAMVREAINLKKMKKNYAGKKKPLK